MSLVGLGCVKTSTLAAGVEASRRNCIPESQILLHTRDVMPSWRIVFSTFRGYIGEVDSVRHEPTGRDERTDVVHRRQMVPRRERDNDVAMSGSRDIGW